LKPYLISILFFLTISAFGQSQRSELAKSGIYLDGIYGNGKNVYTGIEIKTFLKDTSIQGRKYTIIQMESFKDYSKQVEKNIFFENFYNGSYTLLDHNFKVINQLNYLTSKAQQATLLGITDSVELEFIDTRDYMPRDSLVPNSKPPRKYYLKNRKEYNIVIIPDLKTMAVSVKGKNYTQQLFGDNFNSFSKSVANNLSVSNDFKIQRGDEIQLFYRRKWYNDTTGMAEDEDKQFKNIKYIGDTTIDNNRALKFSMEGYNYLSGDKEEKSEFVSVITDSGFYNNEQFVPFKNFKNELKIIDNGEENYVFIQGVDYDSIGRSIYPKVIQYYSNSPYRYYILPFFPVLFMEFGNVQGIISYSKINGIVNGEKRERTFITDQTNLREINCINESQISVSLFIKQDCELSISINKDKDNKEIFEQRIKAGDQILHLKTPHLTRGSYYQVEINYKDDNESGSISNGFTANY
jgi:hypothetical protein